MQELKVISSPANSESKALAADGNCVLLPKGGPCSILYGAPCAMPTNIVAKTGQEAVEIGGLTALGSSCEFQCPLGGKCSAISTSQGAATHNEAANDNRVAQKPKSTTVEYAAVGLNLSTTNTTAASSPQAPNKVAENDNAANESHFDAGNNNRPPSSRSPSPQNDNKKVAEKMANGHAYDKHILGQPYGKGPKKQVPREFPGAMRTRNQFQDHIEKVISNQNTPQKPLPKNRTAYWDDEFGAVVIKDPKHPDLGTFFQPSLGKKYYDSL